MVSAADRAHLLSGDDTTMTIKVGPELVDFFGYWAEVYDGEHLDWVSPYCADEQSAKKLAEEYIVRAEAP